MDRDLIENVVLCDHFTPVEASHIIGVVTFIDCLKNYWLEAKKLNNEVFATNTVLIADWLPTREVSGVELLFFYFTDKKGREVLDFYPLYMSNSSIDNPLDLMRYSLMSCSDDGSELIYELGEDFIIHEDNYKVFINDVFAKKIEAYVLSNKLSLNGDNKVKSAKVKV